MIEKITSTTTKHYNMLNNVKKNENDNKYEGQSKPDVMLTGEQLHSYMVSFKGKSARLEELKESITPKAEEVYKASQNLAREYGHKEIKQVHVLRTLVGMISDAIAKRDEGDLDAINENTFTSPNVLKDRFGDEVFEDPEKRKILKRILDEEAVILDKKLEEMPKSKGILAKVIKPELSKDYINDMYNEIKSDTADDEGQAEKLSAFSDWYFLDAALWPANEKIVKEISQPFISRLSKGLMVHREEKSIPLKFYEDMGRKIWRNLAVGRNMFVLYDDDRNKNLNKEYLLDTFEKIFKTDKETFGKFNIGNTEINRYNNEINADFIIDEVKRGIKDKDKKHIYIFDYDKACTNESGSSVHQFEKYLKEISKYPNLSFVITSTKEDYYESISKKEEAYKDFSQISIPIINVEQAKKMFHEEKALTKKINKNFSPEAIDKIIEATDKLNGDFPGKAQRIMNLIASYYVDKKSINEEDVGNYINEAKDIFKFAEEKNKSSVQILLDTEVKLDDLIGLKATKKEAESIVRQIKDKSIGTKGYIVYSHDGMPGSGRNYTAKAIAGEAKIPFLEINAVDFGTKEVDIFDGTSTSPESAMKKLFSMAKAQAEINPHKALMLYIQNFEYFSCGDQVSEYHEKAMSQLLREMATAQKQGLNIVVMGSVSDKDLIGESTMKSFKFVDKIEVESPSRNKQSRKELIQHYLEKKEIELDADTPDEKEAMLNKFAEMTEYTSLIHLMTLLNKVKNVAQERGHKKVNQADFIEGYMQIKCGRPAVREMTKHSKDIVTSHECGHAINGTIMNEITKSLKPWAESDLVSFVTLDPRSGYMGAVYTNSPDNEELVFERVFSNLVLDFGGYSCEKGIYGIDGSWGITSDMEQATAQATEAVMLMGQGYNFGRKSLNGVSFLDDADKEKINKDIHAFLKNAETVSNLITEEYRDFIDQFTQKYSSKVGTGECIVPGKQFRKELNEWRKALPKEKQDDLLALNEIIKDIMKATQKGIVVGDK